MAYTPASNFVGAKVETIFLASVLGERISLATCPGGRRMAMFVTRSVLLGHKHSLNL